MEWPALQEGLRALVASASGIDPYNLVWDGEPEAMRSYPMGLLQLTSQDRDRSTDELRYETAEDGSLVAYIVGNRTLVLQVTVHSRDYRARAFTVLERMRARLELPRAQDQLEELGLVLRESTATADSSAVSQQREESVAELSLTLGYFVEERDEEHTEQPIEQVQVSGEVTAPDTTIIVPEQIISKEA